MLIELLLLVSNKWAIAGLAALSAAMVSAVVLISDYHKGPMPIIAGILAAALFGYFWFAFPLARARRSRRRDRDTG